MVSPDRPSHPGQVAGGAQPLSHDGGGRRGADAVPEAHDEDEFYDQVQDGCADSHLEGPHGVLEPPQVPHAGQHDQHGRGTQQADPQVNAGLVGYVTFCPDQGHNPVSQGDAGGGQHHPENEGQPESLDGLVSGPAVLAGTAQPGHGGRRSVGQEHAEAIAEHQEARRHPQPGQRRRAQMAYHRRVG